MKKITFLYLVLINLLILYPSKQSMAQEFSFSKKSIPEVTKPNVETTALGKYGEVPMNLHTGVANITVPLYNIDFDGLDLPINITYNTITPTADKESSWIGLGWTLSCEPVITREIKGQGDLEKNGVTSGGAYVGYLYTDIELPSYGGEISKPLVDKVTLYGYSRNAEYGWDTEPDIFTINIFGESASFVFKQKPLNNNKVEVSFINEDKRFKVEYNESDKNFVVINEKGFKFYFTVKEHSMAAAGTPSTGFIVSNPNSGAYITGWKVSKIESPSGKILYFDYDLIVTETDIKSSHLKYLTSGANLGGNLKPAMHNSSQTNSYYILGNQTYYIKNIKSDCFTVEFTTDERKDLLRTGNCNSPQTTFQYFLGSSKNGPPRLTKLTIKNMNKDVIKDYTFNQSYFNGDKLLGNETNCKLLTQTLRLKLDGINLNEINYRKFSYINPNSLTNKYSKETDFWGYFNGSEKIHGWGYPIFQSNPYTYTNFSTGKTEHYIYRNIEGDDRSADFDYSKAGMLEKVIYPTGGYTILEYEPNDIKVSADNEDEFNLYRLDEKYYKTISSIESLSSDNPRESEIFEITSDAERDIIFKITLSADGNFNNPQFNDSNKKYTVEEKDKDNLSYQIIDVTRNTILVTGHFVENFTYKKGTYQHPLQPIAETSWYTNEERIKLKKGKYKILAQGLKKLGNCFNTETKQDSYFDYSDKIKQYNYGIRVEAIAPPLALAKSFNMQVGGGRVKAISNYDFKGKLLTQKKYKYFLGNDQDINISSGVLLKKLIFWDFRLISSTTTDNTSGGINAVSPVHVLTLYSNNYSETRIPSHIGYSQVIETFIDNNAKENNGSSISEFFNLPDEHKKVEGSNAILLPSDKPYYLSVGVIPDKSFPEINGKIKKQIIFNNKSQKIKEILFEYNNTDMNISNIGRLNKASHGLKSYISNNYLCDGDPTINFSLPTTNQIYNILTEDISLIKKVETDYFNNDSITKTTIYNYNGQYQPSLIKESLSNAGNKYRETALKYPFDLKVSSPYKEMVEKNILEPLVEKNIKNNIAETSNKINYASTNNLYLPTNEQVSHSGTNGFSTEIIYDRYDSKGNLLQYTGKDGISVSYLWCYKGQYPIAEIKNATYADVQTALGLDLATISDLEKPDMSKIDTLRSKLPNAMVTTYTYKPLVGMLTATNPAGITTYYEYDSFNRLKETYIIENGKKRVVEAYNYHYANQ